MSEPTTPYIVSTPPHIKTDEDITKIMQIVCVALVPALIIAGYNFGWYALFVTALSVTACVVTEALCQKIRGVEVTVNDWSAVVTGLLLAGVLPPNVPWFIPVLGGIFAIAIAKHCFGGLGNNIWNPALLARVFLGLSFAPWVYMADWAYTKPRPGLQAAMDKIGTTLNGTSPALATGNPDIVSGATMLSQIARPTVEAPSAAIPTDLQTLINGLFGMEGGCILEVSALALLLGGGLLLATKVISWEIPAVYIGIVGLLGWVLPAPALVNGATAYTPWFSGPWAAHLVGGGLMLGAFFMATDMVTTPLSFKGRVIFAAGCGLLTICIRLYSSAYPEGVCFSILLMNTCVPLIDAWTRPRVFGTGQPKKA